MAPNEAGCKVPAVCEDKVLVNERDNIQKTQDILSLLREHFDNANIDQEKGCDRPKHPNILDVVLDVQGELRVNLMAIINLIRDNIVNKIV